MGDIETVKVKIKDGGHDAVINKSDYNPKLHTLQSDDAKAMAEGADGLTDEERSEFARLDAKRKHEANRGVSAPAGAHVSDKNPSGTFSEPTPTDIRYPNKDETEFENNHGAFVRKSAADLRQEQGLDDKPGGLNPAKKEAEDAKASDAAVDPLAGQSVQKPDFDAMSVSDLKAYADERHINLDGATKKADILEKVKASGK